MTLKQAEYLISIAAHGSITKASKEMFVAQSSLSSTIKEVENEYGLEIFRRDSRGVELTMPGREFIEDLQHMLDQFGYINEKYRKRPQTDVFLSVSTQHHICGDGAFLRLANLYEGNNFALGYLEGNTEQVLGEVETGVSEVGLLFYFLSTKNIVIQDLRNRGMVFNHIAYRKPHLYVHRSHPLAGRVSVTTEDLRHYPSITYDAGGSGASLYTSNLRRASPRMQIYRVNDRAGAYTIMRKQMAYATGTGYQSEDQGYADIVSIPIEGSDGLEVGWLVKDKQRLSDPAEHFIELIKQLYVQ